jgi:hypothetical protein
VVRRTIVIAGAGLFACATAATILGTSEPSGDEILFPHERHEQAKVECITCHENVYDAKTLAGSFLPNEAKCLECHAAWKRQNECSKCHADVKYAGPWPLREPHLQFSHAFHIDRFGEDCTRCHKQLSEPDHPVPLSAGHAACLQCHDHADQYADARCSTCHVDLKHYPLKPVVELSHQGDFLRRHAIVARAGTASCAACHEQNFCLDCHARTAMTPIEVRLPDRPDRQFVHWNDFIGRHPVEARADPASCTRCHALTSCENCHRQENVAPGAANARNPHPQGWTVRGAGPSFHGDAARRDIVSCAACHDQGAGSNCVACHKVGGVGGNPHPSGFLSRHAGDDLHRNRTCAVCHY